MRISFKTELKLNNQLQDMPLKERVFNCGNCGVSIDRDLNASLNLEKQALVVA